MERLVLATALVLVTAASAAADPVLDAVSSVVVKGRRLDVTVDTTFTAAGDVTVAGTVNGIPVSIVKRASPGTHRFKLKVDAKKLGLKRLATGLRFDLDVTAREAAGATATQPADAFVPLPCVYLPGFGNESTPGDAAVFGAALDVAAGGIYTVDGKHPTLVAREYPSTTATLAALGKGLGKAVKSALRGTVFAKVDVVGYSYGGLVARSFLAQGGDASVRHCVFVATPNEGVAAAYIGVGVTSSTLLAPLLEGIPEIETLLSQFDPKSKEAVRNLYPTYSWALWRNTFTQQVEPAPSFVLGLVFTEDDSTPLTALNAMQPPAGVSFDAFFYTSTTSPLGTVETVNLSDLQTALGGDPQNIDPSAFIAGDGDGVVPWHSVVMANGHTAATNAWNAKIVAHPLTNAGTHLDILTNVELVAGVAAILTQ